MKILSNGQVEIKNNKTGETKVVNPEDLPNYGIKYSDYATQKKAYDNITGSSSDISINTQNVSSEPLNQENQTKITDTTSSVSNNKDIYQEAWNKATTIKEKDKIASSYKSATGKNLFGETNEKLSKADSEYSAVMNLVNNLENEYQNSGAGVSNIGPVARVEGVGKSITGATGLNKSASVYNREKKGFAATLKTLTGDTGVLTDQDFARLQELLPKLGDTTEEATKLFDNLRSQVAAKYGKQVEKTTFNPEEQNLLESILGSSINFAKDVGTGLGLKTNESELNQSEQTAYNLANELVKKASTTKDKQEKERLLSIAKDSVNNLTQNRLQLNPEFSKDIEKPYAQRGLETGAQVALTTDALSSIPTIANSLKSATSNISKVIHPFKSVGEYRAAKIAEAGGKTISGDSLLSELRKGLETVSPTAKGSYEKFLKVAEDTYSGKSIGVDDAVKLNNAANDAYTAAGKVGKAATAKFNKVLGDAIKSELKVTAPDVSEANKLFSYLYGAKSAAKKYVVPALIGGGAGAAGAGLLYSLLGINKNK